MAALTSKVYERLQDKRLPVLRVHRERCLELLQDDRRALSDLIPIITLDPGLCAGVLSHVNQRRKAKDEGISTIDSAIGLLGKQSLERIVRAIPVLEDIVASHEATAEFKRLLWRAYHASHQARAWAELKGDKFPNEIYSAGLLRYLGDMMLCAHEPTEYQRINALVAGQGLSDAAAQSRTLGTTLDAVGQALGQRWGLAQITLAGLDPVNVFNYRSMGIVLAGEIARLAERGWYTEAMLTCVGEIADYLSRGEDQVASCLHQTAVDVARTIELDGARPAAANLVFPPGEIAADTPPRAAETPKPADILSLTIPRLKQCKSAGEVLHLVVNALHPGGGFSRALFYLLNQDKTALVPRFVAGVGAQTPLAKGALAMDKAPLMRQVLKQPVAAWIKDDNYMKYSQGLPKPFIEAVRSRRFFLMSVFIGAKPIGVVYADAEGESLTEAQYKQFKMLCTLASKAVAALHQPGAAKQSTRTAQAGG